MTTYITALFVFLVLQQANCELRHVAGTFGSLVIPLDFEFGTDTMVITTHIPTGAPSSLRPTSNLHIFSKQMVAIRNERDGVCYIQRFNATMEGMRQKVEDALSTHTYFQGVKDEIIFTDKLNPLPAKIVARLGYKIKQFCDNLVIYYVSEGNSVIVKPNDTLFLHRGKRFVMQQPSRLSRPPSDDILSGLWRPWRPTNPWGPGKNKWDGVLIMC